MEIKTFKKGEILFKQGDPGECMYDVYTGKVGIYSTNTADDEAASARQTVEAIVRSHDHIVDFHGFYLDPVAKRINFDIIIGYDAKDPDAIYTSICDEVQQRFPDYTVIVIQDADVSD